MTIRRKMVKGAIWSLVEKGGQHVAAFLLFLVVERLSGPEEYGLAMLAFVYLSLTNMLLVDMAESVVTLQLKDNERLSTFILDNFRSWPWL